MASKRETKHILQACTIALFLYSNLAVAQTTPKIGVCYGVLGSHLPPPAKAVSLMTSRNIGKARIYAANHLIQQALANSSIELIVDVSNAELQKVATNQAAATGWVHDNILPFYPATKIKYIAVGNEVLPNDPAAQYLFPAMQNIQTAIVNASLQNNIKVSTASAMTVLGNSYPPSQGAFSEQLKPTLTNILNFLAKNAAPFLVNVYPYFAYIANKQTVSLDYALFRSTKPVVVDQGRNYTNLFDAMVDSLYSAIEALGHPNVSVVVTESGWPWSGNPSAIMPNARTYNNNLIKHVLSNVGTPKRPGRPIETYIFDLFNENLKPGLMTERHFGLFHPSTNPVYPVNFNPPVPPS